MHSIFQESQSHHHWICHNIIKTFSKKNSPDIRRRKGSKYSSWEICAQKAQHVTAGMLETLMYKVELTVEWEQDSFSKIWLFIQIMEVL